MEKKKKEEERRCRGGRRNNEIQWNTEVACFLFIVPYQHGCFCFLLCFVTQSTAIHKSAIGILRKPCCPTFFLHRFAIRQRELWSARVSTC